jgi:hypothetical protein
MAGRKKLLRIDLNIRWSLVPGQSKIIVPELEPNEEVTYVDECGGDLVYEDVDGMEGVARVAYIEVDKK